MAESRRQSPLFTFGKCVCPHAHTHCSARLKMQCVPHRHRRDFLEKEGSTVKDTSGKHEYDLRTHALDSAEEIRCSNAPTYQGFWSLLTLPFWSRACPDANPGATEYILTYIGGKKCISEHRACALLFFLKHRLNQRLEATRTNTIHS